MYLLVALLITGLIYYICADIIRKHSVFVYVALYLLIACLVWVNSYDLIIQNENTFLNSVIVFFNKGILSMATFIWVMYLGIFVKHNKLTKKLMIIRGEMSIIGCILAIGHNLIFGWSYLTFLFFNPLEFGAFGLIISILTLVAIILMLVLGVTSFKTIRKKMKPKKWKNIQRLAYVFFYLMYIQVLVLLMMNWRERLIDIFIYSVIFLGYGVLRIRKYILISMKK